MRSVVPLMLFFQSWLVSAQPAMSGQPLLTYYDCAESYLPDMPLFLAGEGFEMRVSAADFLLGVPVNVLSDAAGSIAGLEIGPRIRVPLAALYDGIRFGFPPFGGRGMTLHTLEVLPTFHPDRGGPVRFGHLKNFTLGRLLRTVAFGDSAVQRWRDVKELADRAGRGREVSLSRSMGEYYGEEWGQFTFHILRENGGWVARGLDGQLIEELFTMFAVNRGGQVKGLVEMLAFGPSNDARTRPKCYRPSSR